MRRGQSSTIIHEDSWALLGLGRGEVPFQIQGRKEAGKSSLGVSLFDLDWDERVNAYFSHLPWPFGLVRLFVSEKPQSKTGVPTLAMAELIACAG